MHKSWKSTQSSIKNAPASTTCKMTWPGRGQTSEINNLYNTFHRFFKRPEAPKIMSTWEPKMEPQWTQNQTVSKQTHLNKNTATTRPCNKQVCVVMFVPKNEICSRWEAPQNIKNLMKPPKSLQWATTIARSFQNTQSA